MQGYILGSWGAILMEIGHDDYGLIPRFLLVGSSLSSSFHFSSSAPLIKSHSVSENSPIKPITKLK